MTNVLNVLQDVPKRRNIKWTSEREITYLRICDHVVCERFKICRLVVVKEIIRKRRWEDKELILTTIHIQCTPYDRMVKYSVSVWCLRWTWIKDENEDPLYFGLKFELLICPFLLLGVSVSCLTLSQVSRNPWHSFTVYLPPPRPGLASRGLKRRTFIAE